jgi:hypothetical protein
MIEPNEVFPGAWLLDKDGQPFSVESFVYMPDYVGGTYALNGLHLLSECSPIEVHKVVEAISGKLLHFILAWNIRKGEWYVEDESSGRVEFKTKHLHQLQAFFNLHYTPITINEQQLREALNAN